MGYALIIAAAAMLAFMLGWLFRGRRAARAPVAPPPPGALDDTPRWLLQAQLQGLLDCVDDLAWFKDRDSRFTRVNHKFAELFGRKPEELVGASDFDLSSAPAAHRYRADDQRVLAEGRALRLLEEVQHTPEEIGYSETRKRPLHDPQGRIIGTVGVARDVTLRQRYEQQIEYLALRDPLTGLHNRRHLEQAFSAFAERTPQFAALLIDLDNFKLINDTDGHAVGDELLRVLAQRLRRSVAAGCMLVRLGGDEFLVLHPMSEADRGTIDIVAGTISRAISGPCHLGHHRYAISSSLGIAAYPEHGGDRLSLIKHADLALHRAKALGRNRFQWFEPTLASETAQRRSIEQRLREALERRAFALHYQPIFDGASGRIVTAECLLRLVDGREPPLPPGLFIPVAEETGLIDALGTWVIREALLQLARWRKIGHRELRLALNISGLQFSEPGFAERLARWLKEAGVPGEALELELTEGVLMTDIDTKLDTLHALRALQVRLAIDDFGTGYSSLAYLKRLPIQRLKIDRSFVVGLPGSAADSAITRSILQLARTFQLEVTAEGVETAAQLDFLRSVHACEVQGYYLGRPLPWGEFEQLLQQDRLATSGV
ncbi:EAL domain-containing protein [Niveibacterium sp. SC-1]|uniref:putative bifunctional diguanylate cyclase/phosphodiesterase n=1 Tax=Niveibacterium sp. SC-1 TaxID=3135646 RepID=UPI00311EBF22